MNTVRVLPRQWCDALADLVAGARSELVLTAPFITAEGTRLLRDHKSTEIKARGRIEIVTDLSPVHVCDDSLDPGALADLVHCDERSTVWHVPSLHAKVYIADSERAIVTSGNLTAGGFYRNFEYGVEIKDVSLVQSIRQDIADLQAIGAVVPRDCMQQYAEIAVRVKESAIRQRVSVDPALRRAFNNALSAAETELVRLRLAGGAMHTIFAKTIDLMLQRHGPLTTPALHLLVQQLHPDLCDDTIDRVIDGKRFGKKWKHAVRTAQQQLKKGGSIRYDGETWSSNRNIQ